MRLDPTYRLASSHFGGTKPTSKNAVVIVCLVGDMKFAAAPIQDRHPEVAALLRGPRRMSGPRHCRWLPCFTAEAVAHRGSPKKEGEHLRVTDRGYRRLSHISISPAAAEHLDVEIADLLAQRIAVDPEQVGGADLVAAGGRERHREQRMLDLPQNAVIEAGGRQLVAEGRKVS